MKTLPYTSDSQTEESGDKWARQMQQDIQTLEQLQFVEQPFFDGLFTMTLPDSILEGKRETAQGLLFYSHKEKVALSVRLADKPDVIRPEKLKADYMLGMKASRQQAQIEEDGTVDAPIGPAYYFLASHAMPGEKQYDFAVLFPAGGRMAVMDFSFHESGMILWKNLLRRLVMTIQ